MEVYWYDIEEEKLVLYSKEEHGIIPGDKKFLFWQKPDQEDLLLISKTAYGIISSHTDLHIKSLMADKNNIVPKSDAEHNEKPSGAGKCFGNKITDWESIGYNIVTPKCFQNPILDALGFNVH